MPDPLTEFLNVDLHLRSVGRLEALCGAFGQAVMVLHHDKVGRKHWVVLELARSPKTPSAAIRRFAGLAARLRGRTRAVWAASDKELDIGFQAGLQPNSAEWVIDSEAMAAAARMGARLRLTLYSPRQLMKTRQSDVRANKVLKPTRRTPLART